MRDFLTGRAMFFVVDRRLPARHQLGGGTIAPPRALV
jgi:hypothetical protein